MYRGGCGDYHRLSTRVPDSDAFICPGDEARGMRRHRRHALLGLGAIGVFAGAVVALAGWLLPGIALATLAFVAVLVGTWPELAADVWHATTG